MTIELLTSSPDSTSKHAIVEFFSGKQLTICGTKDLADNFAIQIASPPYQAFPDYASWVRNVLRRQAEHDYTIAKGLQNLRLPYEGFSSTRLLARIRQANSSGYVVLLDSSRTQGEIQEGEPAVAYLLGCANIALPLGRIRYIM